MRSREMTLYSTYPTAVYTHVCHFCVSEGSNFLILMKMIKITDKHRIK